MDVSRPAGFSDGTFAARQRFVSALEKNGGSVRLFLCGDVMSARGIDQILPHPSAPEIHESAVSDARQYVKFAETVNGAIPRRVGFEYFWGDALEELTRNAPDARIINLETSVTLSDDWMAKGINYRMHPKNVGCLEAARIDCCVLSNNHVLDYGRGGLLETLSTLHRSGLRTAGAGRNAAEASAPAVIPTKSGARVLVFGIGLESSGIPGDWAAREDAPGISLLKGSVTEGAHLLRRRIESVRRTGDVVVASVHWGGNWGFHVPDQEEDLARALIDEAGVDVVHGHSSHHVKGIEVYAGKLVLFGCGDFINDYEGIAGLSEYRDDLALMYFATVDCGTGALRSLEMVPMHIRRFRLERASLEDAAWLREVLDREGDLYGTSVQLDSRGILELRWSSERLSGLLGGALRAGTEGRR